MKPKVVGLVASRASGLVRIVPPYQDMGAVGYIPAGSGNCVCFLFLLGTSPLHPRGGFEKPPHKLVQYFTSLATLYQVFDLTE